MRVMSGYGCAMGISMVPVRELGFFHVGKYLVWEQKDRKSKGVSEIKSVTHTYYAERCQTEITVDLNGTEVTFTHQSNQSAQPSVDVQDDFDN